ncbi:hypothetical protein ACA910_016586 [Epithemia clementina (nom. ined.)]
MTAVSITSARTTSTFEEPLSTSSSAIKNLRGLEEESRRWSWYGGKAGGDQEGMGKGYHRTHTPIAYVQNRSLVFVVGWCF